MFGRVIKIGSFLIAAGLYLVTASSAVAQKLEVEVMSAARFAEEKGDATGQQYAKALSGEKTVVCGDGKTVCSEDQVCLKCTYKTYDPNEVGSVNTNTEKGKCVAKSELNLANLRQNWPEDGNCLAKQKTFLNGFTIYPGVITIEDEGFLSQGSVSTLGFTLSRDVHEFKGKDGKKYQLYISEKPTIVYGNNGDESEGFRGCEVLPVKIYNHQKCFFCPLSAVIFGAANSVTKQSFEIFASSFAVLAVLVFAIWLAFTALAQVFPMTKQDAPKFLSSILKQGFKVAFVFFLLIHSQDLFKQFVVPVLSSGLKMGTAIQAVSMPEPDNWEPTTLKMPMEESYFNIPISKNKVNLEKGAVSDTLYFRIEQFLATVQAQLSYMQAIGNTLFCVGGHSIITLSFDQFKAGLRMMFLGGILTAFGFLLTFSFAFYFLDGLLQLAVLGAMLPLMIAGWPVKATGQYATTGLKMLLNTFFVMFFTGFVISVNIVLINASLSFSQKQNAITAKGETATGFQAITDAINAQNLGLLQEATNIGGTGFLLLAFSCIFGFKFVTQVSPLAGTLSAGGFKGGLAGKVGTMGASLAKGAAGKTLAPVASGFRQATGGVRGMAARVGGGLTGGIVGLVGKGLSKAGAKRMGGGVQKFGGKISTFGKKIRDVHKQQARDEARDRWG